MEMGGFDVFAAMDLDLQKAAERVLKEGVKRLAPGVLEASATVCADS